MQRAHVSIPFGSRVFCVSHRDDPDGLASAALVRRATGCRFALVGYDDINRVLSGLPRGLDWLVVSDLGLDEQPDVIHGLPSAARHILYTDHHLLSARTKLLLRREDVVVRHSPEECTSVLAWDTFRNQLPRVAVNLAAYGP